MNTATIVNGSTTGAYIDFRFYFVSNANNPLPIFMEFHTYTYDVDRDSLREYVEISGFSSYVINNPTQLDYIGARKRFES